MPFYAALRLPRACRRGPWGFAAFKYLVILGHAHFHIIFLHLSALHVLRTFRRIFEAGLSVNDFISKTKTQQRQVPSPVWSTLELQSDCAVNFNNNTPELIQNPRRKNTKLPAIANMFVGAPFFPDSISSLSSLLGHRPTCQHYRNVRGRLFRKNNCLFLLGASVADLLEKPLLSVQSNPICFLLRRAWSLLVRNWLRWMPRASGRSRNQVTRKSLRKVRT